MSKEADEIKDLYFPCLDHGFVALKDYMGCDADIAEAARVSYGAGTKKTSDDRALIRYMVSHRHTSPLEMVELKFHVRLPIFVARQLIRHRTANVNEYSLRYSLPSMQFYVPEPEQVGTQSKSNKQGRGDRVTESQYANTAAQWRHLQDRAVGLYEVLVNPEIDMARELARMHLPLSIYTEWYWKLDLHNLFHFLGLRSDPHAQWEIQQFSDIKAGIAKRVAPIAFEAWQDYEFHAVRFSRQERAILNLLVNNSELDGDARERLMRDYYGFTAREVEEFKGKISGLKSTDSRSFDLDLAKAKTAAYFKEKFDAAVPKVDQEHS